MRLVCTLAVGLSLFMFLPVVLAAPIAPIAASDGPARLLGDLNAQPDDYGRSSNPEAFRRLGDIVLFRARTHSHGVELWKSDGTVAGTSLVKDVAPGPSGGLAGGFTPQFFAVNGVMVFMADDGIHGLELWRTDGTTAGTFLLRDLRPGLDSPFRYREGSGSLRTIWEHAVSGGLLYFLADDGNHGFELWRTDGTTAGTFLLRDIQSGQGSPFGSQNTFFFVDGTTLGSTFYFRATNDAIGTELWKTDGTMAGTHLVQDIIPGVASGYPFSLSTINGALVFGAAGRLYRSDGVSVTVLSDVDPSCGQSFPGRSFIKADPFLYFHACQALYRTDGTPDGTVFLRDFAPNNSGPPMNFLGPVGDRLLFLANDGVHGREPWSSDGTPEGTALVKDINAAPSASNFNFYLIDGAVTWFMADDGVHGFELWRTDGGPDGTRLVADLTPGPGSAGFQSMIPWHGGLLFANSLGLFRIAPGTDEFTQIAPVSGRLTAFGSLAVFAYDDELHGSEPWKTDGTADGTGMLKDVNDLPRTLGSFPFFIGTATGSGGAARALYAITDEVGRSFWVTDGTSRGTTRLHSSLEPLDAGTVLDGVVYFQASDDGRTVQLWRSDGTTAGTRLVRDLREESRQVVSRPGRCGTRICFFARDDDDRFELWSSDGTEPGTAIVVETVAFPGSLAEVGDTLYFDAVDDVHGRELWTTDGTAAGTRLVKDIRPGFNVGCCHRMTPFNSRLLVTADDGVHGYEPWITDGTEDGTFLLEDIAPGAIGTFSEPVVAGGLAYFAANDGEHGEELWRTDGTAAGTFLLKDIARGPATSSPGLLGPMGDAVVFVTRQPGTDAIELWKSDGTEEGTVRVRDHVPSHAFSAGALDGGILFTALDDEHGLELWRTDGTSEGTVFVQDVAPGPAWSFAESFVQVGSSIVFVADDPVAGFELFSGRAAILLGRPEQAARDLRNDLLALGLPKGVERTLSTQLDAAAKSLAGGRVVQAEIALTNFIRLVDVYSPRPIAGDEAENLVQFARDLLKLIATGPAPQGRTAPKPTGPRPRGG